MYLNLAKKSTIQSLCQGENIEVVVLALQLSILILFYSCSVLGTASDHPCNNAPEEQQATLANAWYASFCGQGTIFHISFGVQLLVQNMW